LTDSIDKKNLKRKMHLNLQLALDCMSLQDSLRIVREVQEYVDWIEAGTPMITVEGLRFVKELKRLFPSKPIVADLKILAGEKFLAEEAFKAGADIITVQACADDVTIKRTIEIARKHNKKIMVDFLGLREKVVERAKEIEKLDPDLIILHTWVDPHQRELSKQLEKVSKTVKTPIAIAGGINPDNIDTLLEFKPSVVIVGRGIYGSKNPVLAAKTIKEKMKDSEK